MTLPIEMRVLNTLADMKVAQNCIFLCEEKSEEELKEGATDGANQDDKKNGDSNVEMIDDSENIRTVIVNNEVDVSDFQRYQVDIDWTLRQLIDFLASTYGIEGDARLRDHTFNRYYHTEELDNKLRRYE